MISGQPDEDTAAPDSQIRKPDFDSAVKLAKDQLTNMQIAVVKMGESDPVKRIEHAESCGFCFEHLCFEIGRKIELGWTLEAEYLPWIGSVLTGRTVKPPKKKGRPKNPASDLNVVAAVQLLVDTGLAPTRNDEKRGPHDSACDAVSRAMIELKRMPRSYGRIEEIWTNRQNKSV